MIEHLFTAPTACGGLPLPPLRGPPTPECGGVGKFRVEAQSPLLANSEQHVYGGKSHPALHPLPTPVQGWVASAYILSCAPLLVRGERATQWRGGIAEGTPEADSREPEA